MNVCHWVGSDQCRGVGPKHDGPHDECRPCQETHCRLCGIEHVLGSVLTPTGEPVPVQTCPRCVGATRADLADVATLYDLLPDQATHHATAAIPGGNATVMLSPGGRYYAQTKTHAILAAVDQAAEEGRQLTDSELAAFTADESPADPTPPLLTLATWEDDFREHRGDSEGPLATVPGCVEYLSRVLHEVAQTHDGFDEFVTDIRRTRVALESTLLAGKRAIEGARCLEPDCGALLRQPYLRPRPCQHSTAARTQLAAWLTYVPANTTVGWLQVAEARRACGRTGCDQGGRRDDWRCPACKRRYTDKDYRRAVAQEHAEQVPHRTGTEIAQALGIKAGRVRLWAHRGQIGQVGTDKRGRPLYDMREARALMMRYGIAC